MCGIAGLLNRNGDPASPVVLRAMADAIAHRGPDGEGYFVEGAAGLAHRRLAIIDLSPAAHQPMLSSDDRLVMTYNGEVYNYQELRIELEQKGHRFRSKSDSEVVLAAIREWGVDALKRLNGMFALAVWDRASRELLLARDRYGVKPLYYSAQGPVFMFGSEVKALRAHGSLSSSLDLEALLEYFTFQNLFTDRTLFTGVRMLAAGSYMRICQNATCEPQAVRYWDYHLVEASEQRSEQDYLDELDYLFRQAVGRQLVSDVEVGSYLSGGMDSGSITAIAASQLRDLKTFTCGFDLHSASGLELSFDEREKAEYMSYCFGTEHYEMVLKAGDMERVMSRLVRHLEDPRVGQSYPNFYVAQLASKFVKVVLSGSGGDELFGGYPWRYYRAVVNNDFDHYVDKYYEYWQRLLDRETATSVFAPIWSEVKHVSTRDIFRQQFATHADALCRPEDYVNHSLYFEARTFLHGLLVVEDKLSMAHGLETRVPFLDNDLVDFAMRLPVRFKLGNLTEVIRLNENEPGPKTHLYFDQTRDGKLLLRKAMARHIPAQVTQWQKQGFSAPDASWFKGESIDYVRDRLFDEHAPIYQYMDAHAVRSLLQEHLDGKQNRRLLIWSLLNVNEWCQQFL